MTAADLAHKIAPSVPVAKCVHCRHDLIHPAKCSFCGQWHHETTITLLLQGRVRLKSTFDESLRDWQDIAQGYQEGASQ